MKHTDCAATTPAPARPHLPVGRRSLLPGVALVMLVLWALVGLHQQHQLAGPNRPIHPTSPSHPCVRPRVPGNLPAPVLGAPVPAALLSAVTAVCPQARLAIGGGRAADGTANAALNAVLPQPNDLQQVGGKPTILYVGGEFCPYCAAERWALLNALARFGTFHGITYMRSADDDGDIATFSFAHATYASPYLSAILREVRDRESRHFQTISVQNNKVWTTLGERKVPFIDINGQYIAFASNEDVDAVSGLSWSAIAGGLSDPESPVANWLLGKANVLTAALCSQTDNQPAATCQEPEIQALARALQ